ncbi:hypothetical protein MUB04_14650 [Acinetobacter indicus]|uniref:hypothetical protein n=1 Tax=Acinetobacter TaxID=469 RepID=UPI0015D11096|nr:MULTISPECIES: hypothetical protein [Acinetobacter]MCP0917772.1 hypothetical protein [Acinetobacter indicus]
MTSNNQNSRDSEINDLLLRKQRLVDRVNSRKGKRHWLFKKMPMKAASIETLANSTEELMNNVKSVNSIVCPKCSNGILMCDNEISRNYPDKVEWWCSASCGFKVFSLPTFKAIREAVKAPAYYIAQQRLANMTPEEIEKIIKEHQYKSKLFRVATYSFFFMAIMQVFSQQWFLVIQWLIITVLVFLFSLKWAYRAWQVKSKNIHLKHSPFVGWLFNAPKWFSLDWYDNNEEKRAQLQHIVDENEEFANKESKPRHQAK